MIEPVELEARRASVAWHAGHPGVFGDLGGNEIHSTMVRWLGVRRVTEFIEHLIRVGRETNPHVLFSYASYPSTEFLLPQNVDFFCFNVYLHNQKDFERYLLRLQNLAEERPLILGEFGMDTIRHTEDEQAEMLGWHVDSVARCGLAGTIFFAWTDEWFTGGQEITDWAFGLVTRHREPKQVFPLLHDKFGQTDPQFPPCPMPAPPAPYGIAFARAPVSTTDRIFTFVTRQGIIARFMRMHVVPLLAPLVASRSSVRRFLFHTVSQIGIRYRTSDLSAGSAGRIHGGDRLPWVELSSGTDNFEPLTTMRWQAHIYGSASESLVRCCSELSLPLHVFEWNERMTAAGLRRDVLYVVRPDAYLALIDASADSRRLTEYFRRRGLTPASVSRSQA